MRRALLVPAAHLAALLVATAPLLAQAAAEQCAVCHGELAQELARSVHGPASIGCTTCHGGEPGTVDMTEAHGLLLDPLTDPRDSVEACGQCHADPARMKASGLRTDALSLYRTSHHGVGLAQGGTDVATCVSCHGAHEVLSASDPRASTHRANQAETCGLCHADPERMAPHELSPDVVAEYAASVHGRAIAGEGRLSAPACADCHGAHGAAPPTVEQVGQVCGECHTQARRWFEQGPHGAAARAGKLEECLSCHGHHTVVSPSPEMLLGDAAGHCGSCHQDASALDAAAAIHADLSRLDERIAETERTLARAGAEGLFLESERGYLDEARSLRRRAGPLTHSLSSELLDDLMNRGDAMIAQTLESLEVKHRALRDRRIFTAVYFVVIAALVLVLLLYRREMYGGLWGARDDGGRPRGGGGS